MPENLFLQTVIALIWDFDKTLTPSYMQEPLFRHFNVDSKKFWGEVNGIPDFYKHNGLTRVESDIVYLNHILTYVNSGIFPGLNNELLRGLGKQIEFYLGMPEFLGILKKAIEEDRNFKQHEIKVEHYIVSTGLKQVILGSAVANYIDDVWACEFVENVPQPGYDKATSSFESSRVISQIGYMLDNTTKTRAIFEINKGTNKFQKIDVNASITREDRRVPFQNMIYIADGPSDIPVFSLINEYGGKTFAVYAPQNEKEFIQVNELQNQARVQSLGEANYTEGSQTYLWITNAVRQIAERIAKDRSKWLENNVGPPPKHITN